MCVSSGCFYQLACKDDVLMFCRSLRQKLVVKAAGRFGKFKVKYDELSAGEGEVVDQLA